MVLAINEALQAPVRYIEVPAAAVGIAELLPSSMPAACKHSSCSRQSAYNAPVDLDWKAAQAKAGTSVYLGQSVNETAQLAGLFIAQSHYLESWGYGRTLRTWCRSSR